MAQDTPNGYGYPYSFEQRMDRMEAFLQSMTSFVQLQAEKATLQHEQMMEEIRESREEIRDLLTLQREHRVDIMALFSSQKDVKQRLDELGKGKSE